MAANYTGNPIAVEAPSSAPGPGVAPIISLPADTDGATWANLFQAFKCLADFAAFTTTSTFPAFGDGSDGSYTLDGVQAAVAGLFGKAGNTYTLLRDAFFVNLTVTGAGVILKTNGFRIYGTGILTTASGGSINCDGGAGGAASASTPGTAGQPSAAGTISNGVAGATGNNATGTNVSNSLGGNGGAAGGVANGGTASVSAATAGGVHVLGQVTMGAIFGASGFILVNGGAGGGTGSPAGGTGAPGGGGAGGGSAAIAFRNIQLNAAGDVHCSGGAAGASFLGTSANVTGSGGGGGGLLILVYQLLKAGLTFSAATNCPGGAGAPGLGGGAAGSAGANGTLQAFPLSL